MDYKENFTRPGTSILPILFVAEPQGIPTSPEAVTPALMGSIFVSLSADRARGPQVHTPKPSIARRGEELALLKTHCHSASVCRNGVPSVGVKKTNAGIAPLGSL